MDTVQNRATTKPVIFVTGDITYAWRLAQNRLELSGESKLYGHRYGRHFAEPSGAVLLADLIDSALTFENREVCVVAPRPKPKESNVRYASAYCSCAQFAQSKSGRDGARYAVWRVDRKLGIEPMKGPESVPAPLTKEEEALASTSSLIVVNREFEDGFAKYFDSWPDSFKEPANDAWLIVKWSRPKFGKRSDFWKMLLRKFRDRCIVIATIEHLRQYGMKISRSLSWERTVEELWSEVERSWPSSVEGCKHFVIPFLPSGAVVFSENDGHHTAKLIYDPKNIESTWTEDYDGDMSGYTLCFTAGVALGCPLDGTAPACDNVGDGVVAGVIAGVVAARRLLVKGFESDASTLPELRFPKAGIARTLSGAMPIARSSVARYNERVKREASERCEAAAANSASTAGNDATDSPGVDELDIWSKDQANDFKIETIPIPLVNKNWRIIETTLRSDDLIKEQAVKIATEGSEDVDFDFPTLRIGKLFITDRDEMENVRAARDLMTNYMHMPQISRPLSIAVFGSPGSGKSFAIKALARELSTRHLHNIGEELEELTFNVSQFVEPDALASALQQVRDIGLAGKMPLVFWDEFDTSFNGAFGWIRYFLAPMQDGQFQDGSMMHRVGRAIFVFAGGTCTSMSEFRRCAEGAAAAKVPDFISRLQGFIDVPALDYKTSRSRAATMLRRADLLRSFLLEAGGELKQSVKDDRGEFRERLNIDSGVLDAFLDVKAYNYGARSIEAIVKMSALPGKAMYDRSSLPPADQLALHVDADDFLQLLEKEWSSSERRT
jgi:DNA replication protein DnaC